MPQLDGRVAIVTGGARGIGGATVKAPEDIVREFGHLDILVNNAGIGSMEDVEQETRAG